MDWHRLALAPLGAALAVWGCAAARGPEQTAAAYARALSDNRLEEAYALTSDEQHAAETWAQFQARYADPSQRKATAQGVLANRRAQLGGLELTESPKGWAVSDWVADPGPEEALRRFLEAAERKDFVAAYRLLSASWRAQYSPERFKADFAAEPLAQERLSRARQALSSSSPVRQGDGVSFNIGEGRAVRLVREGRAFRIAAIE